MGRSLVGWIRKASHAKAQRRKGEPEDVQGFVVGTNLGGHTWEGVCGVLFLGADLRVRPDFRRGRPPCLPGL